MKKKLFALLIAGVMAMSVNAFAAETELTEEMTTESAADTSTVVLQGLDDNGITWTLALNAENAMGCVALTPEGDETTYITGALAFGDGTFTITDEEDGQDYEFGYQDVSQTETILTYEPTDSEVKLAVVDQNIVHENPNYSVYAGIEPDGTQITMGFDWDNLEMAIDERSEEGQNALSGTFTVGEDRQTVTFTTTEGAEVSFTVVDVEGVDNQIDVTLNDTVIRLSLVDMNTLQ